MLSQVSVEQWGMITAAQVRALGVSRYDVSRLVHDGVLERMPNAARVYRLVGAPLEPDRDGLRAVWLQLGDDRPASAWLRQPPAVVSHRSAAAVLELGDLLADVHEFYVFRRRQLRRFDVRLQINAQLPRDQWRVINGLPVCTAEKVITDLLAQREDESAIARICQDAVRSGQLTRKRLADLASAFTQPYGAVSGEVLAARWAGDEHS